jgi:hypothetical protein
LGGPGSGKGTYIFILKLDNVPFWLKNMDLFTYQQVIYSEIKSNQAHHWANKSNPKLVKVFSSHQSLWSSLSNKKYNETITVEDTYLTVSQEVNKIWTFGKKLCPSGLILKPFFTLIANKKNL